MSETNGNGSAVLNLVEVSKFFPVGGGLGRAPVQLRAVDKVTLSVGSHETVGLVGESGSGKTTLGWTVARLHEPTSGVVEFEGRDISHVRKRALRSVHRRLQMVFQNPWTSLDPQFSVGDSIAEPLEIHRVGSGRDRGDRVEQLLQL